MTPAHENSRGGASQFYEARINLNLWEGAQMSLSLKTASSLSFSLVKTGIAKIYPTLKLFYEKAHQVCGSFIASLKFGPGFRA